MEPSVFLLQTLNSGTGKQYEARGLFFYALCCNINIDSMRTALLNSQAPLAERMRPSRLDELIGQEHLTGKNGVIRKAIQTGNIPSMILWGPPGVGKTTIANIIANEVKKPFYTLSAVSSGVKEVREVIEKSRVSQRSILFIDEIHRFNKS